MKLLPTPLIGLTLIETSPIRDERGSFVRVFCDDELEAIRPGLRFHQINLSVTQHRGTVRGMHFQYPPAAEGKLIRCVRGKVFDVAVDLRVDSTTYLHWHAVELDANALVQVFIPEGFAHGFQALSNDAQLIYMHTARWSREHEGTLRYDDPMLAIAWPLPVLHVSTKDRSAPLIDADFTGIHA